MTQMHVNAVEQVWGAATRHGLANSAGIKSFVVWRFSFLAASRDAAWLRRVLPPQLSLEPRVQLASPTGCPAAIPRETTLPAPGKLKLGLIQTQHN